MSDTVRAMVAGVWIELRWFGHHAAKPSMWGWRREGESAFRWQSGFHSRGIAEMAAETEIGRAGR